MKLIVEINPVEEPDYAQIVANISDIATGIFDIRHNMKRRYESDVDKEMYMYGSQADLLDAIFEELSEKFPNVDIQ